MVTAYSVILHMSPIPPHTAHGLLFHHTLHMVPHSTTHCTWSPTPPHTAHGPLFHHTLHMVPYSTTHCTWSPIPQHTAHGPLLHHTLHMVPYSTTHCTWSPIPPHTAHGPLFHPIHPSPSRNLKANRSSPTADVFKTTGCIITLMYILTLKVP